MQGVSSDQHAALKEQAAVFARLLPSRRTGVGASVAEPKTAEGLTNTTLADRAAAAVACNEPIHACCTCHLTAIPAWVVGQAEVTLSVDTAEVNWLPGVVINTAGVVPTGSESDFVPPLVSI